MTLISDFLPGLFFRGAKSTVMQISFVMLILILFSEQILGGKRLRGGTCLRGRSLPPV